MSSASVILQVAEAVSALSLPVGGGLGAYIKWRKSAERDRRAREEAARLASDKAATDARKEESVTRDKLLREKDLRIEGLQRDLTAEEAKSGRLQEQIIALLSSGKFHSKEQ